MSLFDDYLADFCQSLSSLMAEIRQQTKSANVCLYLLPPIADHVIVHLGGDSCPIFLHTAECTGVLKNETKVSSQLNYHVI